MIERSDGDVVEVLTIIERSDGAVVEVLTIIERSDGAVVEANVMSSGFLNY